MATAKENVYFSVEDENGDEYFCPLNSVKNRKSVTDSEMLDCVEKDVTQRYSGNFEIDGN